MYAAIDIGNTLIKVGIFNLDKMVEKYSFKSLEELGNSMDLLSYERVIVASVNQSYEDVRLKLNLAKGTIFLDRNTAIPFSNSYLSTSIGIDRIALAAGAVHHFPLKNNLVIDLGTCITYDFVNKENQYLGGAISPGLQMRFKSLHTFTARLPLIDSKTLPTVDLGNTTENSIISGVTHGIKGEIELFISNFQKKHSAINVILCGGDANFFESKIKATIFAIPELLLEGLNAILRHNASI